MSEAIKRILDTCGWRSEGDLIMKFVVQFWSEFHQKWQDYSAILLLIAVAGCSTVQARRDDPPVLDVRTTASLQDFQGCFAEATAKENVQYLPRRDGGTFSVGAGPQRYVFWVVDIDDLGSDRRVRLYATGATKKVVQQVRSCI